MGFSAIRLMQIRESLGINKAEAARRLQMSAMGYGRYENGSRTPSYQTACYIAQVLGTSADYLYEMTDDPNPAEVVISPADDPELCILVDRLRNFDENTRRRLIAYCLHLTENADPLSEPADS